MSVKKALTYNISLSFNQGMPRNDLGLKGGGKGAGGPKGAEARDLENCAAYTRSCKKIFYTVIFPVSDEPDDQTGGGRSAR